MNVIVPIIFIIILLPFKNNYNSFCEGVKNAIKLIVDIAPYIITIMLMVALMRASGITLFLSNLLSPVFNFLNIPPELSEFILLRPFSGSGSLALLNDIVVRYGADSLVSRIACVIMGSSETTFYVSALYLNKVKNKKISSAILLALLISFISIILSCLIVKLIS